MTLTRACAVFILALGGLLPLSATGSAAAAAVTPTYGNKTITDAGDILRFALPAAAAGISYWKGDYRGLVQFAVAYTASIGIAYGLKQVIHERRPDGSDWKSMPSDSAASAEAASAYLWHRYGWQYGLPAEAISIFVGYSRVQAKAHHWYDVAAGDGLAWGVNMLLVSRKRDDRYRITMVPEPGGASLHFAMDL